MNLKRYFAVVASAIAAAIGAPIAAAAVSPLPIDAIAQHPAITGPALSPDGEHIAALVASDDHEWPVISIWKSDDLSQTPVWIPSQFMRIVFVDFLSNDQIIFVADEPLNFGRTKTFTRKVFVADIKGETIEEPLRTQGSLNDAVRRAEQFGVGVSVFRRLPEGRLLIERTNTSNGSQQIYLLEEGERPRVVAEGGARTFYLSSGVHPITGELLMKQELVNEDGDFWVKTYHRAGEDADWVEQVPLNNRLKDYAALSIQGFDADINKLVVIHDKDSEFSKTYLYDVRTQTFEAEPLFEHASFNVVDIGFSRPTDSNELSEQFISSVTVEGPSFETIMLDERWAGVMNEMRKTFPNMQVDLIDRRSKSNRALISVESGNTPPTYLFYDDGKLLPLGSERPWIDPATLGNMSWVTYTARDGLEIPAILTLPPGYSEGDRVPAVVLPHGGPWARDYMGWDGSGWPQFLSSRGVAVLQPQYRGSTGLGKSLWYAGHKEWGQKMQDDKDDGANWMVSQGIAQEDKLAIFGYSYGGFAAIAASVRPQSPYQCAISGAGVSSIERLGNLWGANRINKERQAWTVDGMDPMKNVDKASIPILLYHGDRDRQADTEHSRMFYDAMKRVNADVRYVEIKDMWHQLPWWPTWHDQTLGLIEEFLSSDKCNQIIAPGVRQRAALD